MKLSLLLAIIIISVLIAGNILLSKKFVLDLLMVNDGNFKEADLIVVLEGGSIDFAPTHERVNKAIELYKFNYSKVLVCAYEEHKQSVLKKLFSRGIESDSIIESYYTYNGKKGGGTYNNVLEIFSVIEKNDKFKNILIVTSPYHELRVSLIISKIILRTEKSELISIKYAHINNSELLHTNTARFIRVIGRELLGILGFYFNVLQDELFKLFIPVFWNDNDGAKYV